MAELALRAVVCTRRLSNENNINSEKHLQIEVAKIKDKTSSKTTSTKNMDSVIYLSEECQVFTDKDSSEVKGKAGHAQEDFEDEGVGSNNSSEGSDPGSEGDRKKRCCDRYDSSESSDSGVVVLSSTDCSSSSSACSGHSDITEPGSPYSSPTSAALCSPEDFPSSHSEESEDSPSPPAMGLPHDEHSLPSEEEPRPPDPCWPPYQVIEKPSTSSSPSPKTSKKRPYPFNNCNATSTPKRFRTNSGTTGTTNNLIVNNNNNNINHSPANTTSLILPYQPVNLNNNQKPIFQKIDTKINNNVETQQQQQTQQPQKWPLPKQNLVAEGIKGQGKITEYFKTQVKATSANQKSNVSLLGKKGQVKSGVKKDSINKFFRFYSGNPPVTKEQICVQPVTVCDKESRGGKMVNLLLEESLASKNNAALPSETNSDNQQHVVETTTVSQDSCVSESSSVHKKCGQRLVSIQTEVVKSASIVKNGMRNRELELINNRPGSLSDFNKSNDVLSILKKVDAATKSSKMLVNKEVSVVSRLNLEVQIPDTVSPPKSSVLLPPPTKRAARLVETESLVCKFSSELVEDKSSRDTPPAETVHVIGNTSCKETLSPEADNKTESAADSSSAAAAAAAPLSPILSVPRVIRFPVAQRSQAGGLEAEAEMVRCNWAKCELEFRCGSKLLEHLQSHHVNSQMRSEQFVCLWVGCKVYERTSCSLSWLERHVLSHGGSKPFRCIVDGCGQRFSSQSSLERHVNGHFNAPAGISSNGSSNNGTRRSVDAANNKLFRRNGKKLRYRRQPWSARMFDYIDTGIMEGVQYRLLNMTSQQMNNVSTTEEEQQLSAGNCVALRSRVLARRVELDGTAKVLVHWQPEDILPDEWVAESEVKATQVVPLSKLNPCAAATLHHSLLPPNCKVTRKPRKPVSKKAAASTSNS